MEFTARSTEGGALEAAREESVKIGYEIRRSLLTGDPTRCCSALPNWWQ